MLGRCLHGCDASLTGWSRARRTLGCIPTCQTNGYGVGSLVVSQQSTTTLASRFLKAASMDSLQVWPQFGSGLPLAATLVPPWPFGSVLCRARESIQSNCCASHWSRPMLGGRSARFETQGCQRGMPVRLRSSRGLVNTHLKLIALQHCPSLESLARSTDGNQVTRILPEVSTSFSRRSSLLRLWRLRLLGGVQRTVWRLRVESAGQFVQQVVHIVRAQSLELGRM
jgi:hypothetical protein